LPVKICIQETFQSAVSSS